MPPRKPVGKRAKIWEIKTRPELLHPVLERKHEQMAADIKEQFVRIDQKYEELAKILDRKGVFGGWRPVYRAFMEELWKVTANYTGKTAEIQAAAIASKYYKYGADPEVLTEVGELFGLKEAVETGVTPPAVIDEFIELKDTPDSYEGQGGKTVRVRSDETGLEFAETIDEFAELKDTPNTYAGQAEKFVRVRSDETGLEFAEVPPPRSPATFIVAAADSLHKERADFVCDGVDDQEEINNAINSLPAGGGRVVLLEGTYHLTAPIKILKSNVVLEGNGWNTELFLEDGSDCNMIEIGDGATSLKSVVVRNMHLDGNKANQSAGHGIYVHGASGYEIYDVLIENCLIQETYGNHIRTEYAFRCYVRGNYFYSSKFPPSPHAVYCGNSSCVRIIANNCEIEGGVVWHAFYLSSVTDFIIAKNYTKNPNSRHITLSSCERGRISGNIMKDAGNADYGAEVGDSKHIIVEENIIVKVATNGIYAHGGEKNTFASNIINGDGTTPVGIHIYDTPYSEIIGNIIFGVTSYCIEAYYMDNSVVKECILLDASDGIDLYDSVSCVICGNYINVSGEGIYIDGSNENVCEGNIFYGCDSGIELYNSHRNSILGNRFDYGNRGVKVNSGCENTYICGNYFNGNMIDIDDAGTATIYAYTEDIPLMMSSDAVDASTTGAKNYEHSEQLWSAPNIYNVLQALVIIDYDWAATADGTFQLYSVSFDTVLGESSSKSGGESSRYETFSVDIPPGETSILMRANITTAGASGEQVTLHRAILRLLRSLNQHLVVIMY